MSLPGLRSPENSRLRGLFQAQAASPDKSQRSATDAAAAEGLGTACTRTGERMLAALGVLDEAATRFEPAKAVPFGGVLCAVGALLENGLLDPVREHLGKLQYAWAVFERLSRIGSSAWVFVVS